MGLDDKQLAALARKNAAKVAKEKAKTRRKFDDTLSEEQESNDAQRLFREMKRREN